MNWLLGILKPMKYCSCESPMMIAAAEVKPEMTGCARKETRKPRRRKPAQGQG